MSICVHPLCIDPGHPSLQGHFPGRPVVPGVLILDAVLEAIERECGRGQRVLRLPQVKFLQPLLPAQRASIELDMIDLGTGETRVRFRLLRDAILLASGELVLGA